MRTRKPSPVTFAVVRTMGLALPDTEASTSWGSPSLKVRGTMFACMAVHKSAEPNTLAVRIDFADRDALIAEDPDTYYLKDHYAGYPCVLVRLASVNADALRDLLAGAHRYVSAKTTSRRRGNTSGRARATGRSGS